MKQKYLQFVSLGVLIALTAGTALAQVSTNAKMAEYDAALKTINGRLAMLSESSVSEAEELCPGMVRKLKKNFSGVQESKNIRCFIAYSNNTKVRIR